MTHALVLVGDPLPEGAEQSAATVLSAFDAAPTDGKILSIGRATELSVEGVEGRESTITAVIREALPEVDVALMPHTGRRKKLLCADMDATIVVGETIDELANAVGIKDEVAAITERAMRGELDFEQALDARVAMLKGLEAAQIDRVAQSLTYMPGADALVATMRRHDADCVLVSGGFDRVTSVVRDQLGFHMDKSNHLEVGVDGTLTGTVRKPIVGAQTKRDLLLERAAKSGIDPLDCLAIGDGANDCLMVKRAGMGIAYQAKPKLKTVTQFHIDFTDLRTALYFQGYSDSVISSKP